MRVGVCPAVDLRRVAPMLWSSPPVQDLELTRIPCGFVYKVMRKISTALAVHHAGRFWSTEPMQIVGGDLSVQCRLRSGVGDF